MKILRNILSVLLVVVMVVTTVYSAILLTVRVTVTENLVREVAENLNYAALPLPDGDENGGTTTITEVLNSSLSSLDITMTENEVNDALRSFSVNRIMSDFAAETREWLLGDGAEPTINSAKIAKTVAANMPESLSGLLSMFGNPEEVLAEMLSEYTSQLDLHEYFAQLEPYRPFLSEGALFLALSSVLLIAMLVLVCQKLRVVPWLVSVGIGVSLAGVCCAVLRFRLTGIRQFAVSPVFELTSPVFVMIFYVSTILITGGLALALVSAVAGCLVRSVKRAKAAQSIAPVQSREFSVPQSTDGNPAPDKKSENGADKE